MKYFHTKLSRFDAHESKTPRACGKINDHIKTVTTIARRMFLFPSNFELKCMLIFQGKGKMHTYWLLDYKQPTEARSAVTFNDGT